MFRKKSQQSYLSEFPKGTFIQTEKGFFYILGDKARYHFITRRVLDSWSPQRIVQTDGATVSRYKVIAKMKFRPGTLLFSQASGKMYLVSDHKLRHITSPDILAGLGAERNDAVWVSLDEINLHEEGEPLR